MDNIQLIQKYNHLEARIGELFNDGGKLRDALFNDLNNGDYEKNLQYENAIFDIDVLEVRITQAYWLWDQLGTLLDLQRKCDSEKTIFEVTKKISELIEFMVDDYKNEVDKLKTIELIDYRVIEFGKELKECYKEALGYLKEVQ